MRKFNLDKTNRVNDKPTDNEPFANNVGNIGNIMNLMNSMNGGNGITNQAELISKLMSMSNPTQNGSDNGNVNINNILSSLNNASNKNDNTAKNKNVNTENTVKEKQNGRTQTDQKPQQAKENAVKNTSSNHTNTETPFYENPPYGSADSFTVSEKAKRYIRFSNDHDRLVNKILSKNNKTL